MITQLLWLLVYSRCICAQVHKAAGIWTAQSPCTRGHSLVSHRDCLVPSAQLVLAPLTPRPSSRPARATTRHAEVAKLVDPLGDSADYAGSASTTVFASFDESYVAGFMAAAVAADEVGAHCGFGQRVDKVVVC